MKSVLNNRRFLAATLITALVLAPALAAASGACVLSASGAELGPAWILDPRTLVSAGFDPGEAESIALPDGTALPVATAWRDNGLILLGVENGLTGAVPAGELVPGTASCAWGGLSDRAVICDVLGQVVFDGSIGRLLRMSEEPPLGSAVLDPATGDLLGVTAAYWGEGDALAVAMPVSGISAGARWLTDISARQSGCMLHIDFTPDLSGRWSRHVLMLQDASNGFYTTYELKDPSGGIDLYAVPGHVIYLWAQACTGDPARPESTVHALRVAMTESEPFAKYNYTESEVFTGWLPAASADDQNERAEPARAISVQDLNSKSRALVIQVASSYSVPEEITVPMITAMTTPDGRTYWHGGSFIFMPELMQSDVWHDTIQELFDQDSNLYGSAAPGEYRFTWYFGDAPAGSLVLNVIE